MLYVECWKPNSQKKASSTDQPHLGKPQQHYDLMHITSVCKKAEICMTLASSSSEDEEKRRTNKNVSHLWAKNVMVVCHCFRHELGKADLGFGTSFLTTKVAIPPNNAQITKKKRHPQPNDHHHGMRCHCGGAATLVGCGLY
jgi:hypothetical protein